MPPAVVSLPAVAARGAYTCVFCGQSSAPMLAAWPPEELPSASLVAVVISLGRFDFSLLPIEAKVSCLSWLCSWACQAPAVKKMGDDGACSLGGLPRVFCMVSGSSHRHVGVVCVYMCVAALDQLPNIMKDIRREEADLKKKRQEIRVLREKVCVAVAMAVAMAAKARAHSLWSYVWL